MTQVPGTTSLLRPKNSAERRPPVGDRAAIGLTGGLSAGKSTALAFFEARGARTISADAIVHRLYERDDVRGALREALGGRVLDAAGEVDRRALGELVVSDEALLRALECLIHPFVAEELRAFLDEGAPGGVTVCEVPLLVESSLQGLFDLVVTIEAPPSLRKDRVSARMAGDVFEALDDRLIGDEARSAAADATFVNDGSVDDLRGFVAWVYEGARALIAQGAGGDDRRV